MTNDSNFLITEIKNAFKDVSLEEGIGLSEANAIDSYKDAQFRAECRNKDEKHNWELIPPAELNENYCSLSFFDAKGMRFHLPAFIIAVLTNEFRFDLTFTLTHLSDYTRNQFELLNPKQKTAIALFLRYLSEHQDYEFERPIIKRAIEEYWLV